MVGDGFRVHNFFPSQPKIGMTGMSPFFLLDYGSKWLVPPSDTPRGVGVHPHRGFETVTIAYHGKVAHHDSAGNSGVTVTVASSQYSVEMQNHPVDGPWRIGVPAGRRLTTGYWLLATDY